MTPIATPSPSMTAFQPAPASPIEVVVGLVAIALALGAAILGYRIIRGGRGL